MMASRLCLCVYLSIANPAFSAGLGDIQPLTGVDIPPSYTYLLPSPWHYAVQGNFIDTLTPSPRVNQRLSQASQAHYYAYDPEFHEILGFSPTIQLAAARENTSVFASEGGAWVPDRNEVWFTSSQSAAAPGQYFSVLDLANNNKNNNTLRSPGADTAPLNIQRSYALSGADYHAGRVYLANMGNRTMGLPPSIVAVDPATLEAETVLNSYFGLPFNSIDDLAWTPLPALALGGGSSSSSSAACRGEFLFFTTLDLGAAGEDYFVDAVLPNAVFRFDPAEKVVRSVISRADVLAPNGIRVSMDGTRLYVTDSARIDLTGAGSDSWGSPAIYVYDLDSACLPVNKRLFSLTRTGVADGIHVDAYGRVWTAEGNGVVVRRARDGKELGVFNAEVLASSVNDIANFALAGDRLVILADYRIWVVQLGQHVV